jgi:hypothetical protein
MTTPHRASRTSDLVWFLPIFVLLAVLPPFAGCFQLSAASSRPYLADREGRFLPRSAANPDSESDFPKDPSSIFEEEVGEVVVPGKMRASEIKAELDIRKVGYEDCFDMESLTQRLQEARDSGKADPTILDRFNKRKVEEMFNPEAKVQLDDDAILSSAVANDGTLPGGLTPDQFKQLAANEEVMELLQSAKMQEAMKLMMTDGPDELQRQVERDPELRKVVEKLNTVLGGALGEA